MKLKAATKTKHYELTYLVPGSFTDSELTKVQEEIQGLVKKHSGKILTEEVWGKKPLAYVLRQAGKSQTEAHFVHLRVEFDTTRTQDFQKDVYLVEEVIRHLMVEATEEETPAEE